MTSPEELQAIRARIDELDAKIQALISERAECALEVARAKRAAGETTDFYRPEREAEVLRNVVNRNKGPLKDEEVARLFREIMSVCLALQEPLKIAFLGPEGTFTEAAAVKHFGHSIRTVPMMAIDEVFREVEAGTAHYGVVPVENSTEGVVNHTLDMLVHSPLKICGEVELRIHQHLMSAADDIRKITQVHSHQQSLAQCREWLDANLPHAERVPVSSNAEAALNAKQEAGVAAIAGEMAAEKYGLRILARNIEDQPDNTTRFLVVGRQLVGRSGSDKTSLLVSTHNRPGALYQLLEPLARHGISMTRIESRPARRGMLWDYIFFVDIEGHVQDETVDKALKELEANALLLKVLGSYPNAIL
ncbi:MAG: prephenate dehydratase [Gammaproteobacteria bacterium]